MFMGSVARSMEINGDYNKIYGNCCDVNGDYSTIFGAGAGATAKVTGSYTRYCPEDFCPPPGSAVATRTTINTNTYYH